MESNQIKRDRREEKRRDETTGKGVGEGVLTVDPAFADYHVF